MVNVLSLVSEYGDSRLLLSTRSTHGGLDFADKLVLPDLGTLRAPAHFNWCEVK